MKKSAKKIAGLILAGMAAVSSAFAQAESKSEDKGEKSEVVRLTIADAVDYALQNSRTLKSAQIDLEIKNRAAKYGWNVFLPSLSVSGTMRRTTTIDYDSIVSGVGQGASFKTGMFIPMDTWGNIAKEYGLENNESLHWAAVGTVSASWNFSLAMIQQIKAAKAGYEGGRISWEQSQREVTTQIRKLFYALLLQQESLKIQQTTLENARQRMVQAQTNFRNGAVPEIQLLQTQVNYENTKPEVDMAEQSLRQTLDTYAFLLGMPVGTEIELVGEIEPVYIEANSDELLEKYGGNNLDIQSLRNNIDTLKMNLAAINLSTWTPALVIDWSLQPMLKSYALDFGKWKSSGNWSDNGGLSFTLAWNLTNMLPWSSNRQQAADLKANIAKLELTMETLLENQRVEVRKAVDTLNQAKEQIDAMGRNVTLAQRAYDMSARSYRNGTTELLDLRDAEASLNQAKLGQINQKYQYISALMDLEKALNTGLTRPPAAAEAEKTE